MKKIFVYLITVFFYFRFISSVFGQTPTPTPTPTLPAPHFIYPEGTSFCTNFDIKYSYTWEAQTYLTPTPGGEIKGTTSNVGDVNGTLELDKEKLSDFSVADKKFLLAIKRLLPADLRKTLSIDNRPLKTKANHYVVGKDSDGKETVPEKVPKTEISLPSWWTSLLGESKIFCALFNTCEPPKSLNIQVVQPTVTPPSQNTGCLLTGDLPKTKDVESLSTLEKEFKTKSLWQKTTEIIDDLRNRVRIITKEEVEVENKTRGVLVGGKTLDQQFSFIDSFLPQELIPKTNAPLAGEANYEITINGMPVEKGLNSDKLYYQNLARSRTRYCLLLCSLYPADINISSIDPLCSSCGFKNYPLESLDDSLLDKSLCQKNSDGSCDYFQTGDSPRCDGDPICESGKCYPLMWRQAKDYTNQGCPVPYSANDCSDSSVCRKMTFSKNPQGGYGNCQYSNPNVCVRTDRDEVNSCAALCNWACCAYQK